MPTSLVCRRMMMVGPTLCCGDLEISPAFSTQHTWDRVAPGALGHVCCDCQWHHKQSKMGGKWFPFFNSSSAYERTSPRVRRCSVTGSAGLSFHVVNRWPGPPSSRRGHLSQDSKEAQVGWGSCACPLERVCLVFKIRGQKQHEQEEGRAEVREVMRPLPGGVLCRTKSHSDEVRSHHQLRGSEMQVTQPSDKHHPGL